MILAIAFFWLLLVGLSLNTPTHVKTTNYMESKK